MTHFYDFWSSSRYNLYTIFYFTHKYGSTQLNRPVSEITPTTGHNKSTISRIQNKAKEREYNPEKDPKILLAYVEDAPRASRPKKTTPKVEQEVIKRFQRIQ